MTDNKKTATKKMPALCSAADMLPSGDASPKRSPFQLWGEIDDEPEIDSSISALSAAEMYIQKPYSIQSTHDDTPDHTVLRPPTAHNGSNTVLHAIDLIRHNRVIHGQKRKLRTKLSKVKGDCDIPPLAQVPNEFCETLPTLETLKQSTIVKLAEVPAISDETSDLLLKKSTASILCHVGYSSSSSDALDLLSACLGNYLRSFCLSLLRQQDNYVMGHSTSHTDAFEATLYDQKIAGYQELIKFAKTLVVDYVLKLDDRRTVIESEYSVLSKTPHQSARSMPGHYPNVNSIDLLKGSFEAEPVSPPMGASVEHNDAISRDVFMHQSNGLFFH